MDARGFSLVEMIVALVILTVVILGFGASAGYMLHVSTNAGVRAEALQAVEGRISQIVMDPRYTELESLYEATATDLPGLEGFTMETTVDQYKNTVAGRTTDYKTIMVTVSGPGLSESVSRTIIMGAP